MPLGFNSLFSDNGISIVAFTVVFVIIGLFIAARNTIEQAKRRLTAEEQTVVRLSNEPMATYSAAVAVLDNYGASPAANAMRRALAQDGDGASLPYADWIQRARYLAGIFVFVGLLGTVFGIAEAVTNLGAEVSKSNIAAATQLQDVSNDIFHLLGGMKAAFYSTLAGIFATVVVSAMNSKYLERCAVLQQTIDRLLATVFLPLRDKRDVPVSTAPAKSEATTLTDVKASLDGLNLTIRNMAAELGSTAQTFTDSIAEIETSGQVLSTASQDVSKMMGHLATASASMESAGQILRDDLKQTAERTEALQESLGMIEGTLGLATGQLSTITTGIQDAAELLSRERPGMVEAVEKSALRMTDSVRTMSEQLAESRVQQTEATRSLDASTREAKEQLAGILTRFEVTLNDMIVVAEAADLRSQVKTLMTSVSRVESIVGDQRKQEQDRQAAAQERQMIQREREASTQAREKEAEGIVNLRKQVESVNANVKSAMESIKHLEATSARIERVQSQIHNVEQRLEAPVSERIGRVFAKDYWYRS